MAEKRNGLAAVPSGLFRPTTEPADAEPVDDLAVEQEGQGADAEAVESSPKARPKPKPKGAAPVKTRSRNIRLSDDTHDRLWMLARQRRQPLSAVADDLLSKALPRWEVKRSG